MYEREGEGGRRKKERGREREGGERERRRERDLLLGTDARRALLGKTRSTDDSHLHISAVLPAFANLPLTYCTFFSRDAQSKVQCVNASVCMYVCMYVLYIMSIHTVTSHGRERPSQPSLLGGKKNEAGKEEEEEEEADDVCERQRRRREKRVCWIWRRQSRPLILPRGPRANDLGSRGLDGSRRTSRPECFVAPHRQWGL